MYSYKVEQAIRAASILHKDQVRKGALPIPYISHLISVMLILSDYTNDEDTIIAALLHDTIEDTPYTESEMREDFGNNVTNIVLHVTEPSHNKNGVKTSALEKKVAYIDQLQVAPDAALMIAAADKSHNFRTVVEEYTGVYDRFFKDFGPSTDKRLEVYQAISDVLNSRLKNAIVHEFNHTFTEYIEFLINAKKSRDEH